MLNYILGLFILLRMAFEELVVSSESDSKAMDERGPREDRIGFVSSEEINRDSSR